MCKHIDLDIGANNFIDESLVPDSLSALIPYARIWGFRKPSEQDNFIEAMERERPEEIRKFSILYDEHRDLLSKWSATLPQKQFSEMSDDDWKHPHWAFVALYKIRELTGEGLVSDKETRAKEKHRGQIRQQKYIESLATADSKFRLGDYENYIALLEPYKDLFSNVVQKKFRLARRKTEKR